MNDLDRQTLVFHLSELMQLNCFTKDKINHSFCKAYTKIVISYALPWQVYCQYGSSTFYVLHHKRKSLIFSDQY